METSWWMQNMDNVLMMNKPWQELNSNEWDRKKNKMQETITGKRLNKLPTPWVELKLKGKANLLGTHNNVEGSYLVIPSLPKYALWHAPEIDSILLGENTLTTLNTEHENTELGNNTGREIDENAMQLLKANGYLITIPCNGPNDGPPRYYISAEVTNLLKKITTA